MLKEHHTSLFQNLPIKPLSNLYKGKRKIPCTTGTVTCSVTNPCLTQFRTETANNTNITTGSQDCSRSLPCRGGFVRLVTIVAGQTTRQDVICFLSNPHG